jgi:phospholipase/lecithinase/hemolysin
MNEKLLLLIVVIIIAVLIVLFALHKENHHGHRAGSSRADFNIYLFGDSFSTTGNNVFVYGTNRPYRPNGRYSDNGLTNSDFLAASYGLTAYNAYDPEFKDFAHPKGNLLNLAVGGWTTGNYLEGDNGLPGQVPRFLEFMSTSKAKFDPENDIVLFSSCNANDILGAVTYNPGDDTWSFDTSIILEMHNNLKSIVSQLYGFGVRHLILLDASGYGNIAPGIVFGESNNAAASLKTEAKVLHKSVVDQLSAHTVANWPELDLMIHDLGKSMKQILSNPALYGVRESNAADPTASVPIPHKAPKTILPWKASTSDAFYLAGYGNFGLKDQLPNRDTLHAAFWDDLHPTGHTHSIFTKEIFLPLIGRREYERPYDISAYACRLPNISTSKYPVASKKVKGSGPEKRKIQVYP